MSKFAGRVVYFKSPINSSTGYGRDGIDIATDLLNLRAEVHLTPTYVEAPLPPEIAVLLTQDRPKHYDLGLNHEYPGELGFPRGAKNSIDKLVIWTMYEFTGFSPFNEQQENLAQRLVDADLVLAYDDVTYKALSGYVEDLDRLKVLQGGYDSEFWTPKSDEKYIRDWDQEPFVFIMQGTMSRRKNPFAAINAFNKLKDEYGKDFNAELHMKTTTMSLHPAMEQAYPGLKIFFEKWTSMQLKHFYLNNHCLLAPSWGEGKNLPALEAQTTGMPVIVSRIGGHMQWAGEWCYTVGGELQEHAPNEVSLRVDEDELAETMWHVYNNRGEARMKGELASRIIPQMCDWSVVMERLALLIDEVQPKTR